MNLRTKPKHMIDVLFPVALFFVFALCALTVLLLSARIYQSTTENSSRNHTARTGLSYISEKIHQNDTDGNVHIGQLNGHEALILTQTYDDAIYSTYIYAYDKELKELFLKEDAQADLSAGTTILEIQDFSMEQLEEHLFHFQCTDQNGQTESAVVAVRSEPKSS